MTELKEPCKTCFHKKTSGEMVDPCFSCMQTHIIMTGEKQRMFRYWTDDKLSAQQVLDHNESVMKELSQSILNNPEIMEAFEKLAQYIKEA